MTSKPASRKALATTFAPRSWPSSPGFATRMRSVRVEGAAVIASQALPGAARVVEAGSPARSRSFSLAFGCAWLRLLARPAGCGRLPPMIRPAHADDVPAIAGLVRELARYERLEHQVTGSEDDLREHLFGERPRAEVFLADDAGVVVGFALFFHTYSTFLARPGVYLEDLFVLPEHRRRGWGRALLSAVAQVAVERECGRCEWAALTWNEPALAFYRALGAEVMDEWRTLRVTGDALGGLAAAQTSGGGREGGTRRS